MEAATRCRHVLPPGIDPLATPLGGANRFGPARLRDLGSVLNTSALNRLTLQLDVFNLANFINRDWGAIRTAGFAGGNILNLSYNSLENPA